MAVLGVLNPSPTSLYHRRWPLPIRRFLPRSVLLRLELRKTWGCFWKARSLCTVNSVAMIAVIERVLVFNVSCSGDLIGCRSVDLALVGDKVGPKLRCWLEWVDQWLFTCDAVCLGSPHIEL